MEAKKQKTHISWLQLFSDGKLNIFRLLIENKIFEEF